MPLAGKKRPWERRACDDSVSWGLAHTWCGQEGGAALLDGATSNVLNASPEFSRQKTLDDAIAKL